MKVKKVLIFLLTLLLPCFLFLELWASYRYNKKEKEIKTLEREQVEWVEENKEILTGIAESSSPERIREFAENELGLVAKENREKSEVIIGGKENGN